MISYNSKIKSMLKRVLSSEGFTYWKGNAFIRIKNDVPQCVDYEKSRLWDSIWIQICGNQKAYQLYTDNRYQEEYFFTTDEDFYKQLNVIEQELHDKWIPYLNRKVEEYAITTSMMKAYNEKTDEYVKKVLENNRFPENIEELIDIVKKIYHGKETFDKTKKDEAICMVASLYWEYLLRNYSEYKPFGGDSVPKMLINTPFYQISPLRVAYNAFMKNDYDEYKTGIGLWDVYENGTWIKEIEWEQKIF